MLNELRFYFILFFTPKRIHPSLPDIYTVLMFCRYRFLVFWETRVMVKDGVKELWKEFITPQLDRLGVFLVDNLRKYDAPKLLQKIVFYVFNAREFFFWFVVVSIVVGFVFSWQWTYIMYFSTYMCLKFEDELLDLIL